MTQVQDLSLTLGQVKDRVKELTVEQVSYNQQLSGEQVQNIFSRIASSKKRLVIAREIKLRSI